MTRDEIQTHQVDRPTVSRPHRRERAALIALFLMGAGPACRHKSGEDSGEPGAACVSSDLCDCGASYDGAGTVWPTIQAGLAALPGDDTLYICPGMHWESLIVGEDTNPNYPLDSTMTLMGGSAGDTFISSMLEGPVLAIYGVNLDISALKITGGMGSRGGSSEDDPIDDTVGGGIVDESPGLTLNDVVLRSNTADYGGGMVVANAYGSDYPHVTLTNCSILANIAHAPSGTPGGGGVDLESDQYLLQSINTDWGDGADDNTPDDIDAPIVESGALEETAYNYGAAASFTCSSETGTCVDDD